MRAVAHALLDLVEFEVYERLTSLFTRCLRRPKPQAMRGPYMSEIRLVDRNIHEAILQHAARGSGTLADGLSWYMGDEGSTQLIMRPLDGQIESTRDLRCRARREEISLRPSAAERFFQR